ncbi:MAG: cytochrome c family protein [Verrucomicrobiaceae bacterium]|uniref:cytochrome c family protein n=1 Tax=Aestuariivirga sp. TaxID=2650926 RepID=UPI0030160E4A
MKLSLFVFLALVAVANPASADSDADQGKQIFKKCAACHSVADRTNRVGPSLLGVVGRRVASVTNFNYSDSMKEYGATGAVWDEKTLYLYLTDPKAIVARTKMAFPGLEEQSDRANLIAFLNTAK